MGNEPSNSDLQIEQIGQWKKIGLQHAAEILKNPTTGDEVQKYIVRSISRDNIDTQVKIYHMRKSDLSQCVQVLQFGFQKSGSTCARQNLFVVVTERTTRLSDIDELSYVEAEQMLQTCLKSFADMFELFGMFTITSGLIARNHKNEVKVWINDNFGLNTIEQDPSSAISQNHQIKTLVKLIKSKINQPEQTDQFGNEVLEAETFAEADRIFQQNRRNTCLETTATFRPINNSQDALTESYNPKASLVIDAPSPPSTSASSPMNVSPHMGPCPANMPPANISPVLSLSQKSLSQQPQSHVAGYTSNLMQHRHTLTHPSSSNHPQIRVMYQSPPKNALQVGPTHPNTNPKIPVRNSYPLTQARGSMNTMPIQNPQPKVFSPAQTRFSPMTSQVLGQEYGLATQMKPNNYYRVPHEQPQHPHQQQQQVIQHKAQVSNQQNMMNSKVLMHYFPTDVRKPPQPKPVDRKAQEIRSVYKIPVVDSELVLQRRASDALAQSRGANNVTVIQSRVVSRPQDLKTLVL